MRIINTKLHGILDYILAFTLMLPWITAYNSTSHDSLMLFFTGALVLLYSVITDYEFGMLKLLPMKVHLILDVLVSVFLLLLPRLFGLYNYYGYWPMLLGAGGLLITLLSSSRAYHVTRRDLDITRP